MFHFHKWSLWKVTEEGCGRLVFFGGDARYCYQERVCEKCGLKQIKKEVH